MDAVTGWPGRGHDPDVVLAQFLIDRIAEDRRAASTADWVMQGTWYRSGPEADEVHVARWSPTRVIADCDMRRRLVEGHISTLPRVLHGGEVVVPWELRLMATVYIDHPDYRQEWTP